MIYNNISYKKVHCLLLYAGISRSSLFEGKDNMKKFKQKILSALTSAALALGLAASLPADAVSAQGLSGLSAKEITQRMGLGWNLGNTLDARGSNDGAEVTGLVTETLWGNPRATRNTFRAVKAKGFTTVRIPVTWYNHLDSSYKVDEEWFGRVREVVDYAIDEGLFVILNSHHDEWNKPVPDNYTAARNELITLWEQIAEEFADYDQHLIFEGMNEPRNYNGSNEWNGGISDYWDVVNRLNADFVQTVRNTGGANETRALMIPTYAASSSWTAMNAWAKPNDANVIASIHAYTPYDFAMNGHTVYDDSMGYQLNAFFQDVYNIFISNDIPVCIGEFSASNYNNTAERVKWARDYASHAVYYNVPIVLWDNNAVTNNENASEANGYMDRDTFEWYEASEPVVDALAEEFGAAQTDFTPEYDFDGSVSLVGKDWWSERTITADELTAGFPIDKIESVTLSSTYQFTVFAGDEKVEKVFEYTLPGSRIQDIKAAVSFNDGKEKVITWKVNLDTESMILGRYNQFSSTDASGKFAQRHIILIKLEDLAYFDSVTMTYYDEATGKEVPVTTTKCYRSVTAEGKKQTAPNGCVYVLTTMKGIPAGRFTNGTGLQVKYTFNR